jgi:GNAT superfamily N-acetyltransferase
MEIHIRPATTEDIEDMARLLAVLFSMEKDFTPDRDRQTKGLTMMIGAPEERMVLVADKGGNVVGMVTGQILVSTAQGGLAALVEDLVVAAACRGKGIGGRLLAGIEGWARSVGATRLQLLADKDNGAAAEFYENVGWRETSLVCRRKSDVAGRRRARFARPDATDL